MISEHSGGVAAPAAGPAAAGTWRRLLAFGKRWPVLFRKAHLAAMCLLPLELLTGAALYFPRLHTGLIRVLPVIEAVHNWAGVAFGVLLLLPVLLPLGRRVLARMDWVATFWFVGGLTITGLALWTRLVAPSIREGAFTVHGILAIGALAWVLFHGLVRLETAIRGSDPERQKERRGALNRRAMLSSLGRALIGTAIGTTVVGWMGGVISAIGAAVASPVDTGSNATAGTTTAGAPRPIPGFQLYTVVNGYPDYDPTTYRLKVEGLVETPLALSMDDIMALPQVSETEDFHCVTGWAVPGVKWQGVRLSDVLAPAKLTGGATWISFDSFDGVYTDSLSLVQAGAEGVLLAHHANGQPLAREQGAPLRLLVPGMYGYKSVKWVYRLRLVTARELGYWEVRGYGPDAYLGTINGWPAGSGGIFGGLF